MVESGIKRHQSGIEIGLPTWQASIPLNHRYSVTRRLDLHSGANRIDWRVENWSEMAATGNESWASLVAGENSTNEPSILT